LEVKVGTGTSPGLVNGVLASEKGGGAGVQAANFTAEALAPTPVNVGQKRLVFIQNVKLEGTGADLGGGITNTWHFAAPNAGATLLDVFNVNSAPLYDANYNYTAAGSRRTAKATDSPSLPVVPVLQPGQAVTDIDVKYKFTLHAAWQFDNNTLYVLGKTEWDVHFDGRLSFMGNNTYRFTAGGDNKTHPSTGFTKTQQVPVLQMPDANNAGAAWR
jgi:hypothetical protein